jgi:hypothetical protein
VVKATWVPTVRTVLNGIGWIKPVSLVLVALLSAVAIWLARNRRKMVIVLASFFSAGMLASLISFRVAKSVIVSHVAPAYQTAADHAGRIISEPLVVQTRTVLAVSLLVAGVAWLTGPYRSASAIRSRIALLLSGKLHGSLFSGGETAFTRWVAANKRLLQWLSVIIVAAIMLFVRLSPKLVMLYALAAVVLILIIELFAAPNRATRKTK